MTDVGETFWAVPDEGDRVAWLTPAQALSDLLQNNKSGKVVCENHIDASLPTTWVVITVREDGSFEPGTAPTGTAA